MYLGNWKGVVWTLLVMMRDLSALVGDINIKIQKTNNKLGRLRDFIGSAQCHLLSFSKTPIITIILIITNRLIDNKKVIIILLKDFL